MVYKEVVIAYLEDMGRRRYHAAHLWACPPRAGTEDFIFHCHPPEQQTPTDQHLKEW